MESGDFIERSTLVQFIDVENRPLPDSGAPSSRNGIETLPFNAALEQFEADLLRTLLKKSGGNIEAAAREAGMNMATIYRKLKKYGITRSDYQG